ncbi:hypothetical protein PanWU01x14_115790 [Parasponia andersonii]|uniref:Uncharacterized protein n=1 Tax=Parasponia andersonii TaxID=3476 RepID=A0A2P5CX14_PARAD|nr:hypothetical protein PanWU01x14_115790 [Parasponia andersonii]
MENYKIAVGVNPVQKFKHYQRTACLTEAAEDKAGGPPMPAVVVFGNFAQSPGHCHVIPLFTDKVGSRLQVDPPCPHSC